MPTSSFTTPSAVPDSATLKSTITAFGNAFRALANLTQVTGQLNMPIAGGAQIDMTDKTATGVTTTAVGSTVSGTFSGGGLSISDIGRRILIPGAGAGANNYFGTITSINSPTSAQVTPTTSTAIAGSGTATIGILTSSLNATSLQFVGREIYRFNDSLQATMPVFIILIYGFYGNTIATSQFIIQAQVGIQLTGNGDLTASSSDSLSISYSGGQSGESSLRTTLISDEPGRFNFATFADGSVTNRGILSVKRLVSNLGVNDSRGVNICSRSQDATKQQFISKDGTVLPNAAALSDFMVGLPPSGGSTSTAVFDSNTGIFPVHPYLGREDNPAMDLVLVRSADFANLTTVTLPLYGSNRNFKTIAFNTATNGGLAGVNVAMRWD